jgi:hypothetical protein
MVGRHGRAEKPLLILSYFSLFVISWSPVSGMVLSTFRMDHSSLFNLFWKRSVRVGDALILQVIFCLIKLMLKINHHSLFALEQSTSSMHLERRICLFIVGIQQIFV